jgi:hypothetical protein
MGFWKSCHSQVTHFHVVHELQKKLQQIYEKLEDEKVVKSE